MPLITLTTDIGEQDYLIGAIKGQLVSLSSDFVITDVTHHLPQTNFPQAAYICNNAFKYFPAETFHIVLLNLFELNPTSLLIAKYNGQYIACPDNGILTMIAGVKPEHIIRLPDCQTACNLLEFTKVLANAIYALSIGQYFEETGVVTQDIVEKYPLRPTYGPDWMEGQILFIDHFENVIINITKDEFEEQRKNRSFKIVFKRNEVIDTISKNYAGVTEGEKLAWFNAAGYLEIAVYKGNMAGLFGLQGYDQKMQHQGAFDQNKLFYQTVRIFFL